MLLAKRMKELRMDRGLTQRELGEIINVTKVSICCYENGTRTPTLETLLDLANYFEVDLDYLLGRDKKVDSKPNEKTIRMAKEEIELMKELRKYETVYQLVIANPKRCAELIARKLR